MHEIDGVLCLKVKLVINFSNTSIPKKESNSQIKIYKKSNAFHLQVTFTTKLVNYLLIIYLNFVFC